MARIYLASSWRNPHQPSAIELLRNNGHQVYDFRNPPNGIKGFAWSEIDPDWQGWSAENYRELLTTNPIAARGYMNDFRGMEWADTCVLLLPCGRSAHLEAGWFAGRGKRLIIWTRDGEEPELMALMANHICISAEEVLAALTEGQRVEITIETGVNAGGDFEASVRKIEDSIAMGARRAPRQFRL